MSDECIHGFVDGLCATCNPKAVPEPVAVARPASRGRVATASRPAVRTTRPVARVAVSTAPPRNLLEQRAYHLTHISNLPAILASGAIAAEASPVFELSPDEVRLERFDVPVPGGPAPTLAGYVPFFLSPDAELWRALRAGDKHPRLSSAARTSDAYDFVFLVTTVQQVINAGASFVVADRNSEGSTTRFATARDDAERMLHRLRSEQAGELLLDAELLVADRLPFEYVTLLGVANDRVRERAREILGGADFTPKIAVYPPWFQQPE